MSETSDDREPPTRPAPRGPTSAGGVRSAPTPSALPHSAPPPGALPRSAPEPRPPLPRPPERPPEAELPGEGPRSLVELVNRVLDRGVVVAGDVTISVAGVDLVYLGLNALLTSVSTMRRSMQRQPSRLAGPRPILGELRATGYDLGAASEARAATSEEPGRTEGAAAPVDVTRPVADALAAELTEVAAGLPERLDIDPDAVQRDLARLVLVIVELLRRVVEHQAIQRMGDDDLSEAQVERMGVALERLEAKLAEIKSAFGVADADLNIDLGQLGKLL